MTYDDLTFSPDSMASITGAITEGIDRIGQYLTTNGATTNTGTVPGAAEIIGAALSGEPDRSGVAGPYPVGWSILQLAGAIEKLANAIDNGLITYPS